MSNGRRRRLVKQAHREQIAFDAFARRRRPRAPRRSVNERSYQGKKSRLNRCWHCLEYRNEPAINQRKPPRCSVCASERAA